jgi:hypothetical protein
MSLDIMIDLETLSTGPDAIVLSIGACVFDIKSQQILSTFIQIPDVQDQMKKGREIEASTLKWWFGQSDAAKKVFHEKARPTEEVLKTFSQWIANNVLLKKDRKVWGNGSHFDISILENLFKQYGIEVPWLYYNVYDLRTFKRFVGLNAKVEKQGVNHNALDDAIGQAQYVMKYANPQVPNVP